MVKNTKYIYLTLSFILALILFPVIASAAIRDGSTWVINQNDSKYANSEFTFKNGLTAQTGGCRIFSIANAMNWVNGCYYGDSVISEMVALSGSQGSPSTSNMNYSSVVRAKNVTMVVHNKVPNASGQINNFSFSQADMKAAFRNGWVFQIEVNGHFTLAVDYVYCRASDSDSNILIPVEDDGTNVPDGCTMYIQIIDSWANASTHSGRSFQNAQWYVLQNRKLVLHPSAMPTKGMQYFVSYSTFNKCNKRKNDDVALKGAWLGHGTDEYYSTIDMNIENVPINSEYFPDDHLLDYVRWKFDDDNNGYLDREERNAVQEISISSANNLLGLCFFSNLKTLDCSMCSIETLDLRFNTELISLNCRFASLVSLNLAWNTKLQELDCSCCSLSSLDLRNNTNLVTLNCEMNDIEHLYLGKNKALKKVNCEWNELKSLDITGCTSLEEMYCLNNGMTALDISKCTHLKKLSCSGNYYTELAVECCPELIYLSCSQLSDGISELDVENCRNMQELYCGNVLHELNLSNLTQLQHLSVSMYHIDDLKSLDLSNNTLLKTVGLGGCGFDVDLSHNSLLETIYLSYVTNDTLDFSKNPELKNLTISDSYNVKGLNIRNCTKLTDLDLHDVNIESLDISQNTELKNLRIRITHIRSLDLSHNSELVKLDCWGNNIQELDVSHNPHLFRLNTALNEISSIDVSACHLLVELVKTKEKRDEYWNGYVWGGSSTDFTGFEKSFSVDKTTMVIAGDMVVVPDLPDIEDETETEQMLCLPASLVSIQDEAFRGVNANVIVIDDNVTDIGSLAFADCSNLKMIVIPSSVTSIANNAFSGCSNLVIYGVTGSKAEEYANTHDNCYFGSINDH